MSLFAFTTANPLKAAAELREAGYGGFCLMMMDRRRQHRHRGKGAANFKPQPIVALKGYCFAHDPDPWTVSQMKHVRNGLRFVAGGRWQPIPAREAQWLMDPPHPLFHDTAIPRFVNRPEPPVVKAGDRVRFTLAAELHELPVMAVDGQMLLVQIHLLGRDVKTRVPVEIVEVAWMNIPAGPNHPLTARPNPSTT